MAEAGMSDEKRRLIQESERYRQAITGEVQRLKAATAWVPRTIGIMRAVSPLVALSAPVLGLFLRRKRKVEPRVERDGKTPGMIGKALLAFELLRKAMPFWDSFQRSRPRPSNAKAARPKEPSTRH
jgi:hypothetical protein